MGDRGRVEKLGSGTRLSLVLIRIVSAFPPIRWVQNGGIRFRKIPSFFPLSASAGPSLTASRFVCSQEADQAGYRTRFLPEAYSYLGFLEASLRSRVGARFSKW